MKGNVGKGERAELEAVTHLEAEGYVVHRAVRTSRRIGFQRWINNTNDVFGCIDLVAKKAGERTRWIQVTAHAGIGRKKADLSLVPWNPDIDSVEIWRWVGGKARRHKGTGEWLPRQFFQVYRLDNGYRLEPLDRIQT